MYVINYRSHLFVMVSSSTADFQLAYLNQCCIQKGIFYKCALLRQNCF